MRLVTLVFLLAFALTTEAREIGTEEEPAADTPLVGPGVGEVTEQCDTHKNQDTFVVDEDDVEDISIKNYLPARYGHTRIHVYIHLITTYILEEAYIHSSVHNNTHKAYIHTC